MRIRVRFPQESSIDESKGYLMDLETGIREYNKYCQKLSDKFGDKLPTEFFLYTPITCWKCKDSILVYTWPNRLLWDEQHDFGNRIPPKSVKINTSLTLGSSYVSNSCLSCGAIQGDYYLYMIPDAPFWAIEASDDLSSFKEQLIELARRWGRSNGFSWAFSDSE